MEQAAPLNTTGDVAADYALRDTIAAFAAAFPGRVRGCYAEGSHADGTAIVASDVDLTVVSRGDFRDAAERGEAERLGGERATRRALAEAWSYIQRPRLAALGCSTRCGAETASSAIPAKNSPLRSSAPTTRTPPSLPTQL